MLRMVTADISGFMLFLCAGSKCARRAGTRLEVGPDTFFARVSATSIEAMGRIQSTT